MPDTTPKPRGFATLSEDRRREIASLGGQAAHRKGRAHVYTSETAREAGKKGAAARAAMRALKNPPIVPA